MRRALAAGRAREERAGRALLSRRRVDARASRAAGGRRLIFSRFGTIKSCAIIRDSKTGDSLNYAFVEFEDVASCTQAYFKMDGALVDDRRIKVNKKGHAARLPTRGPAALAAGCCTGLKYWNHIGLSHRGKSQQLNASSKFTLNAGCSRSQNRRAFTLPSKPVYTTVPSVSMSPTSRLDCAAYALKNGSEETTACCAALVPAPMAQWPTPVCAVYVAELPGMPMKSKK